MKMEKPMNKLGSSIVEIAGRLLPSDEFEVVMGDIAEAEEGVLGGLMDVLGLVGRQQLRLWKGWGPWLTSVGIALPAPLTLMGISYSISVSLKRCAGLGLQSLHPLEALPLACQAVLLIAGSWTGGFVLASVSRRTLWMNATICIVLCLFCMARFHVDSLSRFCLIPFLLPSVLGVLRGMTGTSIRKDLAFYTAIVATLSMTFLSMASGVWSLGWMLIWPAWYIVATAVQPRKRAIGQIYGENHA
jgi:hypothetical protein